MIVTSRKPNWRELPEDQLDDRHRFSPPNGISGLGRT